ncbi:MAG: sigma-70 family RNA polymerase sigma factor [Deltaproteobacteria bacterium]|nr:sigma-70 family RNA polymerase sigma factor [Deltaproteobacteria bacterium]
MIHAEARHHWTELEARLRPFVALRVRRAADVDDVIQEIFLRIHRGVSSLRDDQRFGPWVYQVARNAITDHHRALGRHPLVDAHPRQEPADEPADEPDEDSVAEQQLAPYIAAFVAMMPSPYREALTLTELQGLSQREAAAMAQISLSGMKSRVQRGRQQLREALEACCRIALDARGRVVSCEPRSDGQLPGGCCTVVSPEDTSCARSE